MLYGIRLIKDNNYIQNRQKIVINVDDQS